MNLDEIGLEAESIWKSAKNVTLEEMLILLNVITGDIARISRDKSEGKTIDEDELKKELGNIIFSTIRWCQELGYSPKECIELAKKSQEKYKKDLLNG